MRRKSSDSLKRKSFNGVQDENNENSINMGFKSPKKSDFKKNQIIPVDNQRLSLSELSRTPQSQKKAAAKRRATLGAVVVTAAADLLSLNDDSVVGSEAADEMTKASSHLSYSSSSANNESIAEKSSDNLFDSVRDARRETFNGNVDSLLNDDSVASAGDMSDMLYFQDDEESVSRLHKSVMKSTGKTPNRRETASPTTLDNLLNCLENDEDSDASIRLSTSIGSSNISSFVAGESMSMTSGTSPLTGE